MQEFVSKEERKRIIKNTQSQLKLIPLGVAVCLEDLKEMWPEEEN